MDTDCFVRSEVCARRTKLRNDKLEGIRTTLGAEKLNQIRSSVIAAGIDIEGKNQDNVDEIDDLVEKVMGELGDGDDVGDEDESSSAGKDSSFFWAYFLAIPIIFTHGVATRMQFLYSALYGRDGLHMSNGLAILAVGMTAAGRSTAPPLLLKNFKKPWVFVLLNATTLIGSAAMFLIPVVGGRDNFDENGLLKEGEPASVGLILFYYFIMYIQGLTEVLSGWDVLMKFEMKKWSPDRQQLAFRASFVSIALGSSAAFYSSSALYESYGLYGCAYLGTVVGVFNLLFPCFYLARRWSVFSSWRAENAKDRAKLCRKSGALMKMLNLDEDEHNVKRKTFWKRQSTQQLEFMKISTTIPIETIAEDGEEGSDVAKNKEAEDKKYVHYVKPRNYFEYQEQVQHQTSERILKNFLKISRYNSESTGELAIITQDLTREDILKAFNPSVLLTHSEHINWPAKFARQMKTLKWFCILALALGSTMISAQFAVYTLFMVDVWNVSPVFAGTSMAIGEMAGMLTLMLSILIEKIKVNRSEEEEKEEIRGGKQGGCGTLLRNPGLLLHVPSKFVVCCAVAVIPLALMGFVKPPAGIEDMEISIGGISTWPPGLIVTLLSSIAIGVVNCVMHATTIEMSARILLDDSFASAVAIGYSMRRIVNLSVALVATLLYSLNEFAVYQTVACLYILSVPVSVWILEFYVKCMPWQKKYVILDQSPEDEGKSNRYSLAVMNKMSERVSRLEDHPSVER